MEEYILIKIKDIDYVKVLFAEDFPSGWNGVMAQNHIIEILKLLFKNFDVELYCRNRIHKEEGNNYGK